MQQRQPVLQRNLRHQAVDRASHGEPAAPAVSTLLDEHLFRRAKLESIRQRKQVSEILGEALEPYLTDTGGGLTTTGVVAKTWGVLKLDRRKVARRMAGENSLLDA